MADEPTAEDDFGSFFDSLSALEGKAPPADFGASTPVTAEPAAETPLATTPEPSATEGSTDPGADNVAGGGAAAEPPPVAAPPPPKSDATPELLERFVQAIETRAPTAPPPPPTRPAPPPLYTDEEVEALNTFEKDWPDVAKALSLVMRGSTTVNNATIMQQLGQTLAPALQNMQAVQVDHQLNALRQAVPDYDKVRDPVINWALNDQTIPPYLRNAYKGVIEQGEVSEITDLVDRWRQATGNTLTPQGQSAPKPAAKPANELSEAAKQAVASLAPVVSKRTAVVSSALPGDFDGAFEHFAAAKP